MTPIVFGERPKRPSRRSHLEEKIARFLEREGLPRPVRELRFAWPAREWRFDFAWPEVGIAVEIEGGTFSGGRHGRGVGMRGDAEKYNAAMLLGWRVFRVTTDMFNGRGDAFEAVRRALTTEIRYTPPVLVPAAPRKDAHE